MSTSNSKVEAMKMSFKQQSLQFCYNFLYLEKCFHILRLPRSISVTLPNYGMLMYGFLETAKITSQSCWS